MSNSTKHHSKRTPASKYHRGNGADGVPFKRTGDEIYESDQQAMTRLLSALMPRNWGRSRHVGSKRTR